MGRFSQCWFVSLEAPDYQISRLKCTTPRLLLCYLCSTINPHSFDMAPMCAGTSLAVLSTLVLDRQCVYIALSGNKILTCHFQMFQTDPLFRISLSYNTFTRGISKQGPRVMSTTKILSNTASSDTSAWPLITTMKRFSCPPVLTRMLARRA
jgi:hypothetical protein